MGELSIMKYATFDPVTGALTGRYDSDIHETIPASAIELDDVQFRRTIDELDGVWTLLNGVVVKKPMPAPTQVVPAQVTKRQGRLALLAAGKLAAVTDAIAALPSPQREAAEIEWNDASNYERASPFVALLAAEVGLDDEELDALFVAAAQL